jgi:hypothetical protein
MSQIIIAFCTFIATFLILITVFVTFILITGVTGVIAYFQRKSMRKWSRRILSEVEELEEAQSNQTLITALSQPNKIMLKSDSPENLKKNLEKVRSEKDHLENDLKQIRAGKDQLEKELREVKKERNELKGKDELRKMKVRRRRKLKAQKKKIQKLQKLQELKENDQKTRKFKKFMEEEVNSD